MNSHGSAGASPAATVSARVPSVWPNRYDAAVVLLVMAVLVAAAVGSHELDRPLAELRLTPVRLDPSGLPNYALLTILRMFAAMFASLVFTLVVATLAAKSRRAELLIIPALDILQSVPVLGFLSFTVVVFMRLFPGNQLGAEMAAIFAIFTSQAWNMAFSFYQSLKTVPRDLADAAAQFRLSGWQRFWRLEAPYAMPGLVWNAMMSMSGGWFFVVASEAISVGNTTIALPGIGSYLALAIERRDLTAVGWSVFAMAIVILLYDQLVFRPIVAWADKFRMEQTAAQARPQSWLYDMFRRTRAVHRLVASLGGWLELAWRSVARPASSKAPIALSLPAGKAVDLAWLALVVTSAAWSAWTIYAYLQRTLGLADFAEAAIDGAITLVRVGVLIAFASLVWVPIGVWIGLNPRLTQRVQPLAQFLAAFPANVLFPVAVMAIASRGLDPNIWLSPLMVLGTQWYILFNVIAGASAFPTDLREAARLAGVRGWQWWIKVILPGIFPYYVTGALTASGGSWNAAIVAEVVSWGSTRLEAKGLGSYIANATSAGDHPRVVLGIAVMALYVITINRLLWRRLYAYADRHLRLN
ncbi:MAG: ABC transporter permease subunit [Rhizobiales bacterium]|nr:ABC transporter permease subunit [Hyphomicrobiales bacterium]